MPVVAVINISSWHQSILLQSPWTHCTSVTNWDIVRKFCIFPSSII